MILQHEQPSSRPYNQNKVDDLITHFRIPVNVPYPNYDLLEDSFLRQNENAFHQVRSGSLGSHKNLTKADNGLKKEILQPQIMIKPQWTDEKQVKEQQEERRRNLNPYLFDLRQSPSPNVLTPPHNRHVQLGSSLEQFQQQIANQDQHLSLELNSSKEDKSKGDKLDYLNSEHSHYPGFLRAVPAQSEGAVSHFAPRTAEY
jgi:hypothetical protein